MSTRIGKYIFDVDLESMDIEKLSVLKEGCEHFIKEKHREEKYNKGECFERVITETLTGETWVKDSVPFNVAGDITLNGEQVQIKFDGAELTNERTLMRIA